MSPLPSEKKVAKKTEPVEIPEEEKEQAQSPRKKDRSPKKAGLPSASTIQEELEAVRKEGSGQLGSRSSQSLYRRRMTEKGGRKP